MFSCNLPPALLAEWLGSFPATVITQGWNTYGNKSQHRKLTLEKKILLLLLQGLEPATFHSWVWCSNHWAIPAQHFHSMCCSLLGLLDWNVCWLCCSLLGLLDWNVCWLCCSLLGLLDWNVCWLCCSLLGLLDWNVCWLCCSLLGLLDWNVCWLCCSLLGFLDWNSCWLFVGLTSWFFRKLFCNYVICCVLFWLFFFFFLHYSFSACVVKEHPVCLWCCMVPVCSVLCC